MAELHLNNINVLDEVVLTTPLELKKELIYAQHIKHLFIRIQTKVKKIGEIQYKH